MNPEKKDENPFRYCGEYYDKETEEVYLRARYYQPAVGRFLTRDTYTGGSDEPLSLHLYTYCENDGANHVDPSGHILEKIGNSYLKVSNWSFTTFKTERIKSDEYLNYLGNKKLEEVWGKRNLIYDQESKIIGNMKLGTSKIEDVGCELVAIYNAIWVRTKKNKVYIISFWNRGGLFNGVHTIAVMVQDNNKRG